MGTEIRRGINIPPPLSKIYPSFITCSLNYSIIMTSSKRKVSRREVPYLGTLLEKFPFTRLPTKLTVLRRLVFITETAEGNTISKAEATNKTRNELKEVWTYAGYEDILKANANIDKSIKVSLRFI